MTVPSIQKTNSKSIKFINNLLFGNITNISFSIFQALIVPFLIFMGIISTIALGSSHFIMPHLYSRITVLHNIMKSSTMTVILKIAFISSPLIHAVLASIFLFIFGARNMIISIRHLLKTKSKNNEILKLEGDNKQLEETNQLIEENNKEILKLKTENTKLIKQNKKYTSIIKQHKEKIKELNKEKYIFYQISHMIYIQQKKSGNKKVPATQLLKNIENRLIEEILKNTKNEYTQLKNEIKKIDLKNKNFNNLLTKNTTSLTSPIKNTNNQRDKHKMKILAIVIKKIILQKNAQIIFEENLNNILNAENNIFIQIINLIIQELIKNQSNLSLNKKTLEKILIKEIKQNVLQQIIKKCKLKINPQFFNIIKKEELIKNFKKYDNIDLSLFVK